MNNLMKSILVAIAVEVILTVSPTTAQEATLGPHQQLARDILEELIEINTVDSAGTTIAAKAVAARLLNVGFPSEDVHVVGPNDRKNEFSGPSSG
jgi:hypothetical protein